MTPTIEKAARSLCYYAICEFPKCAGKHNTCNTAGEHAIAVLEATLEPSDEEVEAALDAYPDTSDWLDGNERVQEILKCEMRTALRAAALVRLGRTT